MKKMHIEVGPDKKVSIDTVHTVSHNADLNILVSKQGVKKVKQARDFIEKAIKEERVIYGVTTGFGNFKDKTINPGQVNELQKNLITSHSCGVGDLYSKEVIRASIFVRISSLSHGFSGIRNETLDALCDLLNHDILPIVPSQGSVGSSGDLAPLSHTVLPILGIGDVIYKNKRQKATTALKKEGLEAIELEAKEGLALNNGTSYMLGMMALATHKAKRILDIADLSCSLSLEALSGHIDAFNPKAHAIRPHPGQILTAKNILKNLRGSKLVTRGKDRVQDAYSLRCSPQVHGAARDTVEHVENVVSIELNSTTDNPVIFPDIEKAISCGNFHGEPLAMVADFLTIAMAEIANISERRTAKLVDAATSHGLPMFLMPEEKGGLHNGLMIPQYTAAALVSENKILAHPSSVDSIPTSANQEDHVSMGNTAARKCLKVIENVEYVLAIEILNNLQGIDFRDSKLLGTRTGKAYDYIRKHVSFVDEDRVLSVDIEKIKEIITSDDFFNTHLK